MSSRSMSLNKQTKYHKYMYNINATDSGLPSSLYQVWHAALRYLDCDKNRHGNTVLKSLGKTDMFVIYQVLLTGRPSKSTQSSSVYIGVRVVNHASQCLRLPPISVHIVLA